MSQRGTVIIFPRAAAQFAQLGGAATRPGISRGSGDGDEENLDAPEPFTLVSLTDVSERRLRFLLGCALLHTTFSSVTTRTGRAYRHTKCRSPAIVGALATPRTRFDKATHVSRQGSE